MLMIPRFAVIIALAADDIAVTSRRTDPVRGRFHPPQSARSQSSERPSGLSGRQLRRPRLDRRRYPRHAERLATPPRFRRPCMDDHRPL